MVLNKIGLARYRLATLYFTAKYSQDNNNRTNVLTAGKGYCPMRLGLFINIVTQPSPRNS